MKWIFCLLLSASVLHADYPAWFGAMPAFRYLANEKRPATLTVEWAQGVSWPETVARHVRESRLLEKDTLDRLVATFGEGPWNVYLEANDGKGFWVLARRATEEAAGTEPPGEGVPRLLTPAERIDKAKSIFALTGFPVDTLVTRNRSHWVESEGTPGQEKDVAAGVGMFATLDGFRLFPASAQSASAGFDRFGRTTEIRMVWRKTRKEGEFKLVDSAQAEAAILAGKAHTLYFGFAQELGAPPTPEQKVISKALAEEAKQTALLGLTPPTIKRRVVITGAELVLLDYASEEGVYGDENPLRGKFDDILWPMLLLRAEVFTNDHREQGEIYLPAEASYVAGSDSRPLTPPAARARLR